jgi:hypothetical protein
MEEGIFLMAHIYESCIEAGHDLPDLTEIDITYMKMIAWLLLMEFYQFSIFEQSYLYTRGCGIYDQLFVQDK